MNLVERIMSLPVVGQPAPDFTLPSTGGADVTLASFRDNSNVLLAFFPLAFTGTCTAEMCDFSTDYSAFAGKDTVVLPISVDSVPTLKEFKAKERLTLDLLSDFHRTVSTAYGTLLPERNFSTRAYILIDKSGVVRWVHAEANPAEKRDNSELLAQLAALG